MALLKRELHRRTTGPDITHADVWALVFDTDTKTLYVEHDEAHLEARIGGAINMAVSRMEIADYFRSGGQAAGHRQLWRLLRAMFDDERAAGDDAA